MQAEVHVTYGDIKRVWCEDCQSSAGYEAQIYVMTDQDVSTVGLIEGCARCDREA